MAEERDTQKPSHEAVDPASAGYPLPCPHCGGPAELKRHHSDRRRVFYGCADPWCNFTYNEASEALIAWNRRATDNDKDVPTEGGEKKL